MKLDYNSIEEPNLSLHPRGDKMQHYSVPEGYFDRLNADIMERIRLERAMPQAEQIGEVKEPTSLWLKLKPSLYLAASFVGLFVAVKATMAVKDHYLGESEAKVQVSRDNENYLKYYEDYASRLVHNEKEHMLDEAQYEQI